MKYKNKAFTLIELLVVIAIIGILAGVVIASLNSARTKARDARRLSDVRTIQTALDMYYADNGRYPESVSSCTATVPNAEWCNSVEDLSGGRWIGGGALAPYLPSEPADPRPQHPVWDPGSKGVYYYHSTPSTSNYGCQPGQFYRLVVGLESNTYAQGAVGCNGTAVVTGGNLNIVKF